MNIEEFDYEEDIHARNVYLRQSGGKYCTCTCPVCGWPHASMKMSANAGWCKKCDSGWQALALRPVSPIKNGDPASVDYYAHLSLFL